MTQQNQPPEVVHRVPSLEEALDGVLRLPDLTPCRISKLERRPSAYRSSFALEELDVVLASGATLQMMFKDLSWESLTECGRRAKPAFLHDPLREIELYQSVLPSYQLGTAFCYGALANKEEGRYWLFLEKVSGKELYRVGEFGVWQEVARRLAVMHARLAGEMESRRASRLLVYGEEFYRVWPKRAHAFLIASDVSEARRRRRLSRLVERYDQVVAVLTSLPVTLLHGEFYASNILVEQLDGRLRVCPIDWEMAAVGPGLIDLAALLAGKWSEDQKRTLAAAYYEVLQRGGAAPPRDEFLEALDYCRLHLAVQWLGWAADWSPPAEHAQDWLGELLTLAAKRGVV